MDSFSIVASGPIRDFTWRTTPKRDKIIKMCHKKKEYVFFVDIVQKVNPNMASLSPLTMQIVLVCTAETEKFFCHSNTTRILEFILWCSAQKLYLSFSNKASI